MTGENAAIRGTSAASAMRSTPRPTCLLCASPGAPLYLDLTDRLYRAGGRWTIARCTNPACRLMWLDPMPLTEDLHLAYETYFTHGTTVASTAAGHVPSAFRTPFRALRDLAMNLGGIRRDVVTLAHLGLESDPPGRVLELGAGDGERLKRLRARGWRVEGQDVDPGADVFRLRDEGVPVHLGPLEGLSLVPASYDAIVMSHVIEHVPDPLATLRTCAALLRPGGKVVAVTPNTASFGARRYGAAWMALEPPRHLHLFNARNLAELARRAGYARVAVRTTGANGAGVALGSRSIRDTGRFRMGDLSRNAVESALIVLVQALEGLVPGLGEECILVAHAAGP
jgi:2-polyprenyl-3-methyl-5-hydroxy-6-metoxy-1,4-benzoquinol methylase